MTPSATKPPTEIQQLVLDFQNSKINLLFFFFFKVPNLRYFVVASGNSLVQWLTVGCRERWLIILGTYLYERRSLESFSLRSVHMKLHASEGLRKHAPRLDPDFLQRHPQGVQSASSQLDFSWLTLVVIKPQMFS